MQLTEATYTKLAAAAAKDLVERQIPLNESVDKLAASYEMNPEQLARLCETTNNTAFNEMFQQRAKLGSDDRLVEFDVASPKEILRKRVGAEKTAASAPRYREVFDADWESRPLTTVKDNYPQYPTDASMKTASDPLGEIPVKPPSALQMQTALDHLRIEKIAAAQSLADHAAALTEYFRPLYARDQFATFEKEAMALHKEAATELLDHVRAELGLGAVNRDFSKVASYVVLEHKTAAHRTLTAAVSARQRLVAIHNTLQQHGQG